MIVWFQHWKQDQGWWSSLPACNFQVRAPTTVNIKMRVLSVVMQVDMSPGEKQVLQVLTALQYQAKVGLKSPPPGYIAYSMQSTMRPLKQTKISFQPHAVLGYRTSVRLRTSIDTDVLCGIYCHYPPAYVQPGTCTNLMINLMTTSQQWEG